MISKPMLTKSWLTAATSGGEFIALIAARVAFVKWSQVLRLVHQGGVLVVTHHEKPVGVVASFTLVRDLLTEWHGKRIESQHREVRRTIEDLIAGMSFSVQPFRPSVIGVRMRPTSLPDYFEQHTDGIVVVTWRKHDYGCLVSLPILARYKHESHLGANDWTTQVINWLWDPYRVAADEAE